MTLLHTAGWGGQWLCRPEVLVGLLGLGLRRLFQPQSLCQLLRNNLFSRVVLSTFMVAWVAGRLDGD